VAPVGFQALLGQDLAARRLSTMIARDRVAHALLFAGPEGVGKLTAARLLAQILMCTARKKGEVTACDVCPACEKVKALLHADVQLITTDEAHLKIDEIREAMRALQLRPMEGIGKVVIIDGADKLTLQAQNALLKTLEEPPGTSYLILATAKPQVLLPTILSRCQRVPFQPIARPAIARALVEKRSLPEDTAMLVAAMAQGSLGAALALDPEVLAAARDKIAEIDTRLVPGMVNAAGEALDFAGTLGEERAAMGDKLGLLLVWLHDQARIASGAEERDPGRLTNIDRADLLADLAQERGLRMILERAEVVLHAKRQFDLPYNLNGQMIAEQMCLGLVGLVRVPSAA
jgi:DNA polymerase-3 subunit delta'